MPKIPGINHRDAIRALEKAGFRVVRESKHVIMSNGARILTIPRANPVDAFTLGGIVKDAGLTLDYVARSGCRGNIEHSGLKEQI